MNVNLAPEIIKQTFIYDLYQTRKVEACIGLCFAILLRRKYANTSRTCCEYEDLGKWNFVDSVRYSV